MIISCSDDELAYYSILQLIYSLYTTIQMTNQYFYSPILPNVIGFFVKP